MINENFGRLPDGRQTHLYTISCGQLTAKVSDYGAHLVSVLVPDKDGALSDVVLGYDDANGYRTSNGAFLGAVVGRNANRVKGAAFCLNGRAVRLTPNEGVNNLHSGPDCFHLRLWETVFHTENAVRFRLCSPSGDQGFPGNAVIEVTYVLDSLGGLHIVYDADY